MSSDANTLGWTRPQPRHPRLQALLDANKARLRVVAKRRARRILSEAGILNVEVR